MAPSQNQIAFSGRLSTTVGRRFGPAYVQFTIEASSSTGVETIGFDISQRIGIRCALNEASARPIVIGARPRK